MSSTFEKSMNKISKIVETLEKGDVEFEKVVELYETGLTLIKDCKKSLELAENRIKQVELGKSKNV